MRNQRGSYATSQAPRNSSSHAGAASQGSVTDPKAPAAKPASSSPQSGKHNNHKAYWLVRSIGSTASSKLRKKSLKYTSMYRHFKKSRLIRVYCAAVCLLLVVSILGTIAQPFLDKKPYKLSPQAKELLPAVNPHLAELLKFNAKDASYTYNSGYTGTVNPDSDKASASSARLTATFNQDPTKGMSVTDPVNQQTIKMTPQFTMLKGKQDQNQVLYRLANQDGYLVYTARTSSIKEDIVLDSYGSDTARFSYKLELPSGLEARKEVDGSIGIYGVSSALLGNVSTATDKDRELLEKARKNGKKDQVISVIPAPLVLDGQKKESAKVKANFDLEGDTLTIVAGGLEGAKFPLTIDPTVYIASAAQLMKGNNETNTDFDVTNDLIQKSRTTGARINNWTDVLGLPDAVWQQGTAMAGGYVYVAGGRTELKKTFIDKGASTFVVPSGVSSLTVKLWGGGAGGGGGAASAAGGAGGAGGYVTGTLAVTAGETLTLNVGGAGLGGKFDGAGNDAGGGGGGGGYSSIYRSSTPLAIAPGGGGGGGSRNATAGGAGGAGGTLTLGVAGTASGNGGGGGGGTNAAGGGAGSAGSNTGTAGASLAGGAGADGRGAQGVDGSGSAGGIGGGAAGGSPNTISGTTTYAGGGGGGGGYYGGGGGGAPTNANGNGGGGGGGGSAYSSGLTSPTVTTGSGTTPGNSGDADRSYGAVGGGNGGTGGAATADGSDGTPGVIVVSWSGSTGVSQTLSWAHINDTTGAVEATNPGNGTCSGWCTNSAYNLPAALHSFSMLAYNGYLYVIGGSNSGNTPQSTVYIAKLGANGEPQKWHPSGGTPDYWYTDTALPAARSQFAAVAYNNRMYILGGLTGTAPGTVISSNTVIFANINPMGTFTSWTATGMTAMTSNRYGLSAQVYNDTLYVMGGSTSFGGSTLSTVDYVKLNSDGTMNSWVNTSSLTGGRTTIGGSFSTIWGAYIYVSGGCATMNASGYCTAGATDVQLASINADGSLGPWNAILGLNNKRVGFSLISWQGSLYRFGGCISQNTSTGACDAPAGGYSYGTINQDGEASTVANSVASGTAPCSGGSPYSCNLPSVSVGNVLNETVIMNGYLYIMGGCTNNACTAVSTGVTYQSIASDGSLQKPPVCVGSYTDSYCVSSTVLPNGLAAGATAVFNGRIYIVGGFNTNTNIYYTSVNNDGSIAAWSNADLTTIGAADVTYAYAYARANPSAAGSSPGNLFIFGGCTDGTVGCSNYTDGVYKCLISTAGAPSACSKTANGNQLQIGIVTGTDGNPTSSAGLGAMAGAVYANYIYLIGGLAPGTFGTDLKMTRYAKFDNSNNVVAISGSAWTEDSSHQLSTGRRRGAGFGYNGYIYVVGGFEGTTGVLADIEFAKLNVSDGSWGSWTRSTVSINQRWGLSVPISNSYAYVVGGCINGAAPGSCNVRTNTIQTFQIYNNDSGTVASYTNAADDTFSTSADRWGISSAIINGNIYVAGGCTSATDCTTAISDVQYTSISATNGALGTWASTTKALGDTGSGGQVRAWGKLVTVGGYLYYLGGQDSTATNEQSTIYYAKPTPAGDITANWGQASGGIGDTAGQVAQARTKFGVGVWNNRIYVIGGLDGSAAVSSTVYYTPSLASGGDIAVDSWTSDADTFTVARSGLAATAYANNLYLAGGTDTSGNYLNDVQYTQINSDGSIDAWKFSASLPGSIAGAEMFAANGYMYVVGGRSATSSCVPNTLVAPISANTTIATGNNPTGVGEWYETNVRYGGGRYGAALSYYGGKMYVMGGGCTSPLTGAYNTGTISQTTNTVTGAAGANWSDNLVGGTITYQDASTATIIRVASSTSLIVSVSKTVGAGQTYSVSYAHHQYGALKSQPQVAKYSRMVDTDTDVFPTAWLVNGLDNSIGARWQGRYRSMHDLDTVINPSEDCGTSATMAQMTTWGRDTNFGDITLGNVNSYTPRNGSFYNTGTITQSTTAVTGSGTSWTSDYIGGILTYADGTTAKIISVNSTTSITVDVSKTIGSAQAYSVEGGNINCGRYFYFFITIDASQTFGYPEDVNRGPTLYDLSLFFTADPSKRLRHGATFTGGELQPLDTPCRKGSAVSGDPNYNCPLP